VRLVAYGRRAKMALPPLGNGGARAKPRSRKVYFDAGDAIECNVYDREFLRAGNRVAGPALVSEYASTTVMLPGDQLTVAETGELIISIGGV
jgi:N-methylhydantoinase A